MNLLSSKVLFGILAADEPAGEEAGIGTLGFSLASFLFQLLAFLILLFILYRFAYRPLLKIIDERRERAAEIIENSDKIKREAAESEARTRQIIEDARREAQNIITQANTNRDRIVSEAQNQAREAAERETQRAQDAIAAERDQAIQQLRREFADIAILAAGKVVQRELSANKNLHQDLINEVLSNGPAPSTTSAPGPDGRNN